MQIYGYTHEDYDEDNNTATTLAAALYFALNKMKQNGLEDCTEFNRGRVALDRWKYRQNEAIEKINNLLQETSDGNAKIQSKSETSL